MIKIFILGLLIFKILVSKIFILAKILVLKIPFLSKVFMLKVNFLEMLISKNLCPKCLCLEILENILKISLNLKIKETKIIIS